MDILKGNAAYALPMKEGDVRIALTLEDAEGKTEILCFELPLSELNYLYLLDIKNITAGQGVKNVEIMVQMDKVFFSNKTKFDKGASVVIGSIRLSIEQTILIARYNNAIQISNALKKAKERCYSG